MNKEIDNEVIKARQINGFIPQIYKVANKTNKATSPPPRYQMYCAFSPLNSMGLLMPLLI